MIEFMVLGYPRSGTTWASNWLTTDTTLCLHDPLARYRLDELDTINSHHVMGLACTGIGLFPDWLNAHPARKVILHRPVSEVQSAMYANGFNPSIKLGDLTLIKGLHLDWRELWDKPKAIYEHLLNKPFDVERHELLKQMNIQVDYDRVIIGKQAAIKYRAAFDRALR